jgi:DNA-binding LytR/AlgR family response regulator
MKILIVEDDHLMARDLAGQVSKLGYSDVNLATDAEQACSQYRKDPPEVIIVDIKLGRDSVDGITLAADLALLGDHGLIFLTGYPDDAKSPRAQALRPAATLIKPVHAKQLMAALDIAWRKQDQYPLSNSADFSFLKINGKYERINWSDVLYIQAARSSVYIVTEEQRICYSKSLKHILNQISYPNMMRVHRSYVVNLDRIQAFDDNELYVDTGEETQSIPYTATYRDVIYRRLQRMLTN